MKPLEDMSWDELHDLSNRVHTLMEKRDRERARTWQAKSLRNNPEAPLDAFAGWIGDFCADLVFHAQRLNRPITGKFNDKLITAYPDSSPGDLARKWAET